MPVKGESFDVGHGDVVIAAITSCTNTSNPSVLIAAGLVARKARREGPDREAVGEDLAGSRLAGGHRLSDKPPACQADLDALGFNLVGYGCTTCIGNSGPLPAAVSEAITDGDLVACSVLSGNRNFEGRVNPDVRANYLASPPLVVAYALAGSMQLDLTTEPLGTGKDGQPVYPDATSGRPTRKIATIQRKVVTNALFASRYADVFKGDDRWQGIKISGGQTYAWDRRLAPMCRTRPISKGMSMTPQPVTDIVEAAAILGIFGDSITTDHISPGRLDQRKTTPGRPVPDRARRRRGRTSTATAPAAATTKS